ncbi:MAG TPA: inosine monophosphate cyclohydrolase [Ruminococcaceae bacterium]|jgi:IMP cyclohydrolase|nr:inosine monophosphate cyclohydrolase [Oscillospiraceae bacterium]
MKIMTVEQALGTNVYPGRGIMIGRSDDGASAVVAYFIMGRSENSRNRIFVKDGGGIRTQAFDPSKMSDPSLIIYPPVRVWNQYIIVTNGDQTDTIYKSLLGGGSFEDALRTRTFEPDRPNFTPRVSGLAEMGKDFKYRLSIIKSGDAEGKSVQRFFYEYSKPAAGEGHLIHTYSGDGNPLPSFTGEPSTVLLKGGIDEFTAAMWKSLNENNKVSLFVRFVDLKTGRAESRIVNKNA